MPGGEYEAVAVGPAWVGRVELEITRPQRGDDIGHPHWQPRMAEFRPLGGVDCQSADGVSHMPRLRHRPRQDFSLTGQRGFFRNRLGCAVHSELLSPEPWWRL